jgi:hypothetical protein
VAFGFFHNREPGPQPSASAASSEALASLKSFFHPEEEREKELLRLVEENTRPENLLDLASGLKYSMELGVFYLKDPDNRRLGEADKFFKKLEKEFPRPKGRPFAKKLAPELRVHPYWVLSQLGQAMVLAFRNQPQESNERLQMILENERLEKFAGGPWNRSWLNYPQLREVMAQALNFNHANSPGTFPSALEPWRHPPAALVRSGDK